MLVCYAERTPTAESGAHRAADWHATELTLRCVIDQGEGLSARQDCKALLVWGPLRAADTLPGIKT